MSTTGFKFLQVPRGARALTPKYSIRQNEIAYCCHCGEYKFILKIANRKICAKDFIYAVWKENTQDVIILYDYSVVDEILIDGETFVQEANKQIQEQLEKCIYQEVASILNLRTK